MMPYSQFIIPPAKVAKPHDGEGGSMVRASNANFSQEVGFKKVGAHHVILPPGSRSSLPHAESLEEEFVFIVSGRPHAWIDGYVYELKPNVAVGFPAGTGIAHCFVNNTDSDVQLLVFGERTKKENLCSFPASPEHKESCDIWWADASTRILGPHNGRPGPIHPSEVGKEWPSFVIDCDLIKPSSGWHYPGDSETFGEYSRLTDKLGLKVLGIGFERLQPGRRSAFPHSHKTEEEFAFILSGTATIWMNGFVHEAKAGSGVAFVPGTNIAHCLINDSDKPVVYIVVGEANDEKNEDRIFYPQHPFRNEQCRFKKDFWEDRPLDLEVGLHDGRPKMGLGEHLALSHVLPTDSGTVLKIFKESPNYFRRVDGCEPTMNSVQIAITDGPKKLSPTYRKEFLFLEYQDNPIGVVDLHIDHPEAGTAYVGLLLLAERHFAKGLGRKFYDLVEHYAKTTFGTKIMRLGISDDNDVSGFWKNLGFAPNGKTYSWKGENKTTNVIEFDKVLAAL